MPGLSRRAPFVALPGLSVNNPLRVAFVRVLLGRTTYPIPSSVFKRSSRLIDSETFTCSKESLHQGVCGSYLAPEPHQGNRGVSPLSTLCQSRLRRSFPR